MINIDRLHSLVRTNNIIEYDNEEKLCVNSTNFIRKMTNFYNNWQKIVFKYSLEQYVLFGKSAKITCPYGPMFIQSDYYAPYSEKKSQLDYFYFFQQHKVIVCVILMFYLH